MIVQIRYVCLLHHLSYFGGYDAIQMNIMYSRSTVAYKVEHKLTKRS